MLFKWSLKHATAPIARMSYPTREHFKSITDSGKKSLEIGPFYRPVIAGLNVKYCDVLTSQELRDRAESLNLDSSNVPNIDYITPGGDLSLISDKFTNVVSAHCIEHQPDLIRHLRQVEGILEDGGRYFLIVPDKRYCFDYTIPHSTLDEVLMAQGDTTHSLIKVIEHLAFTTHNDAERHWNGDHFDQDWADQQIARARNAINIYEEAVGTYIDVHRWQFIPSGFVGILDSLRSIGLINFFVEEINETPANSQEFTAILRLKA